MTPEMIREIGDALVPLAFFGFLAFLAYIASKDKP